jgi:hypothetical protein
MQCAAVIIKVGVSNVPVQYGTGPETVSYNNATVKDFSFSVASLSGKDIADADGVNKIKIVRIEVSMIGYFFILTTFTIYCNNARYAVINL